MMQRVDAICLPLPCLPLFAYYWWASLPLCLFSSLPLCLFASLPLCLFASLPLCLFASWLLLGLPLALLFLFLPLTLLAGLALASYSISNRVTLPCGSPTVDVLRVEEWSGREDLPSPPPLSSSPTPSAVTQTLYHTSPTTHTLYSGPEELEIGEGVC